MPAVLQYIRLSANHLTISSVYLTDTIITDYNTKGGIVTMEEVVIMVAVICVAVLIIVRMTFNHTEKMKRYEIEQEKLKMEYQEENHLEYPKAERLQ
jgi:short subunit fatty acids transporter